MSIFNIEIDFIRDNERLVKIRRISELINISTLIVSIVLILFIILSSSKNLSLFPLFYVFMIISTAIFIITFIRYYALSLKYNNLKSERVKEEAKESMFLDVKKIIIPLLIVAIIMVAISYLLPGYKNIEFTLTSGKTIYLDQTQLFDSAYIYGIYISGNGKTMIIGNDGSRLIVNDSAIYPNSEIILYDHQGYEVYQVDGQSHLTVQYTGNFGPYYASIILEIISIIPSMLFYIRTRRMI